MQAKISVVLSGKDASKLLEGLAKDPQLSADDDPSVLVEEQFPSEYHAMLQGKTDGTSSDKQHRHHLKMGEAALSASDRRPEGVAHGTEEQNKEVVSVHCNHHKPLG